MGEANRRKAEDSARARRDALTEYELRELAKDPAREAEYKDKLATYTALKQRELEAVTKPIEAIRAETIIEAGLAAAGMPTKERVKPQAGYAGPEGFKGQTNIYVCDACHGHIVTLDVDEGVTPFTLSCRGVEGLNCDKDCRGQMFSSMYRVFNPAMRPSHEWYRPTDLLDVPINALHHVEQGGLILRKVYR